MMALFSRIFRSNWHQKVKITYYTSDGPKEGDVSKPSTALHNPKLKDWEKGYQNSKSILTKFDYF